MLCDVLCDVLCGDHLTKCVDVAFHNVYVIHIYTFSPPPPPPSHTHTLSLSLFLSLSHTHRRLHHANVCNTHTHTHTHTHIIHIHRQTILVYTYIDMYIQTMWWCHESENSKHEILYRPHHNPMRIQNSCVLSIYIVGLAAVFLGGK